MEQYQIEQNKRLEDLSFEVSKLTTTLERLGALLQHIFTQQPLAPRSLHPDEPKN